MITPEGPGAQRQKEYYKMSILESMKEVRVDGPDLTLSINATGATASKGVAETLGVPDGFKIYTDKETKRIAIVAGTAEDYALDKHMSGTASVVLRGFYITRAIHEAAEFTPGDKPYKVPGEFIKEEGLILFDCNNQIPLKNRGRKG